MANSKDALVAEQWIRDIGLKTRFPDKKFSKKLIKLSTGGEFEFDCVDEEETVFALISTSKGKTISGKAATGPIHKVRGESLWFHLLGKANAKKLFIFTEPCLLKVFEDEVKRKRWPTSFELLHIKLPPEIQEGLEKLRKTSRDELRSRKLDVVNDLSDDVVEEIIEN